MFLLLLLYVFVLCFSSVLLHSLSAVLLKFVVFVGVVIAIAIADDVLFQDVKCAFWFGLVWLFVTSSSAVVSITRFFASFFSSHSNQQMESKCF